jgi:hypothetical protein
MRSTTPSAITATPSFRPSARRLMIAPDQRVDHGLEADGRLGNSSGMRVSVAPAALPMPRARCPALRPMATTKYQREVVWASTMRFLTMRRRCGAPSGSRRCRWGGRSRSLSMVFGTWTTRRRPAAFSASCDAEKAVSSPPMVMSLSTPRRRRETTVLSSRCSAFLVGLAAGDPEVGAAPEVDAAHVGLKRQGRTCSMSPFMIH